MTVYNKINLEKTPNHIAIIMDGNGRWAKERGANRHFGHLQGVKVVKKIVETSIKLNVKYLTLFTFSKENWKRPKKEIDLLMNLFVATIKKNKNHFLKHDIKINTIGNLSDLPEKCQLALNEMRRMTKDNNKLTLTLALSYSARSEILNSVNKIITSISAKKKT